MDDLRRALLALEGQTVRPGACVVDNASTDATRHVVDSEFPWVRYERLARNEGFGRALNRGVATGDAELLVFLNNDTVADPGFIEAILEAQGREGAEMVAACLRRPDGQVDSLGVEVDQALNAYDLAVGDRYGDPRHATYEPLGPTGGAAAFLSDAFGRVGGFDEAIFAYLEDVDLAIRMRMEGMRCALAPDAYAWHHHSSTLGSGSDRKNRLLGRSRGYLLWKYGSNLSRHERLTGFAADSVVSLGKVPFDRNLGAVRGRLEARRAYRRPRPAPDPRFGRVPRARIGLRDGLRRRLGRRR